MALRVLVVGGYGNFGSIVCRYLIHTPGVHLLISGRDPHKLAAKVQALQAEGGQPCEAGAAMPWGRNGCRRSRPLRCTG